MIIAIAMNVSDHTALKEPYLLHVRLIYSAWTFKGYPMPYGIDIMQYNARKREAKKVGKNVPFLSRGYIVQFTSHLLEISCVGNTLMNVLCKIFPYIFGLLSKKTEGR